MATIEKIVVPATQKSPAVNMDFDKGIFEIRGRSIPENTVEFYKPIIESLEKYSKNPKEETILHIQLDYFNTSSSKCVLDIFKRLEAIHKSGHKLTINWYYEEDDEDMMEAGEDYQSIINVPFKIIPVPPDN
jgi:hypothetical protein